MSVDRAGFETALAEQRDRSRSGRKADLHRHAGLTALYDGIARRTGDTEFTGYATTAHDARVVAIIRDATEFQEHEARPEVELRTETAAAAELVLERTPFYAEGGGQIGDRGVIRDAASGELLFTVLDTRKPVGGLIVHRGLLHGRIAVGEPVRAEVDVERRERTMRNHTGTHLLHRALRNTVGEAARQAGSQVTPDYLRFDFPFDRPLSADERRAIEREVRGVIRDDRPVEWQLMSMGQAIAAGADAFFDEKYGETVRTVRVVGYSHELCGGTHCRASGQIGSFTITAERSIGSGMRRIEAVTGHAAEALAEERLGVLERSATAAGAQTLEALPARIEELQTRIRELEKRLRAGPVGMPRPAEVAGLATSPAAGVRLVAWSHTFESMEATKGFARDVRGLLGSGVIAIGLEGAEPQLVVTVSDDLVARGISAADLVRLVAPLLGGRGGGRPEMAQAKGTDGSGMAGALAAVAGSLAALVATDEPGRSETG